MTPEEIVAAGEQLKANLAANNAVVAVPSDTSGAQILAANQALVDQTNQRAVRLGEDIELRQQILAPGLNTGSNAPGGYMYQRNMAPVVGALTTGLTANAQQNVLKGAIRDNLYVAQKAYEDAQFAYRERQREYQRQQAERNRQRRIAAERAQAAANAAANRNSGVVGQVRTNAKTGSSSPTIQGGSANKVQSTANPQRQNVSVQNTTGASINTSGKKGISVGPKTMLLKNIKF